MTTMKAWQCHPSPEPCEKRLLLSTTTPVPTITDDQILVETYCAALNPIEHKMLDLGIAKKLMFRSPVTPGMDLCGRITQVGKNATSFHVGDVVFGAVDGIFGAGSLAQFVAVSKNSIALAPRGFEPNDMASIATVGMTVYGALKPNVKVGSRIFINGGSGGTGTASIQIAKAFGCHVTTSCSTINIELCRSLGADEVLDYKSGDVVKMLQSRGRVFDLVLDNVGSPANLYNISHTFLVPGGHFVQVGGGMAWKDVQQLSSNMLLPGFLGGGKMKYTFVTSKANAACFEQLAAWIQEGKLRAVLDSVYEFDDVPAAFARLKTGRAKGKVVVRVNRP